MPWHREPKKDVTNCDKLRGAVSRLWSADFRMEQSGKRKVLSSYTEYIGIWGEPPELKHLSRARKRNQNEIPLVVASERGRGQTESSNTLGVRTVYCMAEHSRMAWEGQSKSVRITYAKCKAGKLYPEYCGTREIPWEYGGTTLQA